MSGFVVPKAAKCLICETLDDPLRGAKKINKLAFTRRSGCNFLVSELQLSMLSRSHSAVVKGKLRKLSDGHCATIFRVSHAGTGVRNP
jgi:hypothetical protein